VLDGIAVSFFTLGVIQFDFVSGLPPDLFGEA
jgi:hypothetical protein